MGVQCDTVISVYIVEWLGQAYLHTYALPIYL
jgi:hypothetical protein